LTKVFITIDTELTFGLHRRGRSLADTFAISIEGQCRSGQFGLSYKARRLEEAGHKAVFFVDPMPALVYGPEFLKPIVERTLSAGHEVQLHLHPEWLRAVDRPPVPARGGMMFDYSQDEQRALLAWGTEQLVRAGAPRPIAFRAGNYGADARTLQALEDLGFLYDSSVNAAYPERQPGMRPDLWPTRHGGLVEVPVSCISDWPGRLRPVQLCAISGWEMRAGLRHAIDAGQGAFVIVSHSFELIDRNADRTIPFLPGRFDRMIDLLVRLRDVAPTAGFRDLASQTLLRKGRPATATFNPVRTGLRLWAQALGR
jgi:peptidoglycan/xylan/chitin deacetylase (PgdA/CDA1 family)